jgi:ABC-type nickel/cobalt efflux system permease component RcnA
MRQKYVTPATVFVVAVVVVVITAFTFIRDGSSGDSHKHEHKSDNTRSHDSTHQDDNSHNDQPSGVIRDGETVIEVKARQFEFDPDRIVVRKGETVRLKVTS